VVEPSSQELNAAGCRTSERKRLETDTMWTPTRALIVLLGGTLAFGVAHAGAASPDPPPPVQVEKPPPSPGPQFVWIAGHWDSRTGRWTWIAGRWVQADGAWIPGRYVKTAEGWVYQEGRWRK
jgi:hypothetical protein